MKICDTIETCRFEATQPGPALLFFGAIHGNEICGPQAIRCIIKEIQSGKVILQKGSATFVPVANPLAYVRRVRYVKENLNRRFRITKNPRSTEARFANILCRLVERCDVLLDLHSITANGKPFIYLDFPTANNRAFARALGPELAVLGWPELYKKLGSKHRSYETTTYAAGQGKDCLLIECGQHDDPASVTVATNAILNALRHYEIIKGKPERRRFCRMKMTAGFFRHHKKDRFARNWKHLDHVKKGESLILNANGTTIKAPYDACIVMPKHNARTGEDWLYLGRRE